MVFVYVGVSEVGILDIKLLLIIVIFLSVIFWVLSMVEVWELLWVIMWVAVCGRIVDLCLIWGRCLVFMVRGVWDWDLGVWDVILVDIGFEEWLCLFVVEVNKIVILFVILNKINRFLKFYNYIKIIKCCKL